MNSIEKLIAEKNGTLENEYEDLVVKKIRRKYSIDQELAIHRKRDSHPEEFAEMNAYIERCIAEAKNEIFGE